MLRRLFFGVVLDLIFLPGISSLAMIVSIQIVVDSLCSKSVSS